MSDDPQDGFYAAVDDELVRTYASNLPAVPWPEWVAQLERWVWQQRQAWTPPWWVAVLDRLWQLICRFLTA